MVDEFHKLVILVLEFLPLQTGKLAQPHLNNCSSLGLCKLEPLYKSLPCIFNCLGCPYDCNHLIHNIKSLQKTLKDMGSGLCLVQFKLCPAHNNIVAVAHVIFYKLLEVKQSWSAVHKRDIVYRETALKRCILEQCVEHHICNRTHLELDYNAHTCTVTLIVHIRNALNLLVLNELCYLLNKLPLVYHVRDLGNNNCLAAALVNLYICLCPYNNSAPTGIKCIPYALEALDDTACREIRSLHMLHQLVCGNVIVVDIGNDGITNLIEVVGSHICSHTYSNT